MGATLWHLMPGIGSSFRNTPYKDRTGGAHSAPIRRNYSLKLPRMRAKQNDARARRRQISTHNPSTPARAPTYARAALYIMSPFSHFLHKPFFLINYFQSFSLLNISFPPKFGYKIIVTMAVENKCTPHLSGVVLLTTGKNSECWCSLFAH